MVSQNVIFIPWWRFIWLFLKYWTVITNSEEKNMKMPKENVINNTKSFNETLCEETRSRVMERYWEESITHSHCDGSLLLDDCLHLNFLSLSHQFSAHSSCPTSQPPSAATRHPPPPLHQFQLLPAAPAGWASQSPWQQDQEVARLLWHSWKAATSWLILVFLSACVVLFPFGSGLRYSAPKTLKSEKGWTHSPRR